jgi:hypothetical protein
MRLIPLSTRLKRDVIAICIFKSEFNSHLRRHAHCDDNGEPFLLQKDVCVISHHMHSATHESHLYFKHARRAFNIYFAFCIKAHDDVTFSSGRAR